MAPQAANALALLACTIASTAANRRLTFGLRGRGGALGHQARGLAIFAIGLAVTAGALATLHQLGPGAARPIELAVLVVANLTVTVLRFLLFRDWVFPPRRPGDRTDEAAP
jgi:putative flippase GtrA